MTLQPGQTVGRYQIIEPLGVGGMATVYKAFQPSLEREVALKVLRPGFADDAEFFQRFQREARSIARLRHPNIVQVFDFEPIDGRYILAMEFLEGGTLKERVTALAAKGERLSHDETARIVGEVAAALSYGHEIGIIHRDVKPSNVMLASRDRAVVTDFGIAKIMGGEGQTQTGVGIGTPEYMAPEQGTGAGVDHRADIYSLGVMAYEMLTGRVPFIADTPLAIVLAHMRDPLPLPSTVDPTVPAAAERVLMKALAKEAKDRHASATEFADALRIALIPPPPTAATVYPIPPIPPEAVTGAVGGASTAAAPTTGVAPASPSRGIPRAALIGAAVVVLLVLAGAAFALTRGGAPGASGSALLFELDPARAQQQLQVRPPGELRSVPNAVELVIGPTQFTQAALVPAVNTSDFDATMRVRLISGTGRVGLFFHSATDGDLQFAVDTQGQAALSRSDPRAQQQTPLATFPIGASLGKDVELRVVAVGTAITMYVDGKEVGRATSPGARTGGIGILVGSFQSGFTGQVQSLRISGTAVATPVGGAAPGAASGAPGGGSGAQGPGCGVVGTNLPSCPPGQTNPAASAAPTAVIRKGAQLFAWKPGDPISNLTIERTGTASTESVNNALRVVVGNRPEDSVRVSMPLRESRQSYVVEYDLLPAGGASISLEFVIRGAPDRSIRLVVDGAMLARIYDEVRGAEPKVILGPAGINERTAGNPQFLLTIRVSEDSRATVYVNSISLFPAPLDIQGTNNQQPLGLKVSGTGGGSGGALGISGIRIYAPD